MISKSLRFACLLLSFALMRCTTKPAQLTDARSSVSTSFQSSHAGSEFRGWDFLASLLLRDGVSPEAVRRVLLDPRMPEFSFVPFKLKPVESHEMYSGVTSSSRLERAYKALESHSEVFVGAKKVFNVGPEIIAAIISVESNWGSFTGNQMVFNRLARVSSTGDPENLLENFRNHSKTDPTVTLQDVKNRAKYLENTFYPNILALFRIYEESPERMLELQGSGAGAYGLPQFLPLSFEKYAADGDRDGIKDLFNPADAIWSVAHYLAAHGWRDDLSFQEKLSVLWHYNRSEAYGRAVVKVSIQAREHFSQRDGLSAKMKRKVKR